MQLRDSTIWIAPSEFVIIGKLEFYREGGGEKHVRDIRGILALTDVDRDVLGKEIAGADWEKCGVSWRRNNARRDSDGIVKRTRTGRENHPARHARIACVMATRKISSKKTTGGASKKTGGKVKASTASAKKSSAPARQSPARKTSAKKTTARKTSRKKESGGLTGFVNRILEKF